MTTPDNNIKYVVIGNPVAHSLSPEMQNAGFEASGLGSPYGKIRVTLEDFPAFVAFAREQLLGFNITVPHKQTILPYLNSISHEAGLAQSVNTVTVKNGKLHGESTDGYGLETALREAFGLNVKNGRFFFIGCGGAVQAVAFHFASRGAKSLCFANRNQDKVTLLISQLTQAYPNVESTCCGLSDLPTLNKFIKNSEVAIQGTSLGLKPEDPPPIPLEMLKNICCYETIYKPTLFLKYAQQAGLKTADGRTMLLHQGAKSFELWTGKTANVEAMRQALYSAIARQQGGEKS